MQGTRIGPFLVQDKLGSHRRHNVYRAIQIEQQREVALKFIKVPPDVPPARAISRIQRETKILKQLDHPNLVRVHGAGIENGQVFFALDLVEGESLAAILSRRSKLAWELAWDYARQIACCLEYLHSREMLHLKLTPDKILISPEGHVKITDLRLNRTKKKRWDSTRKKSMDTAAYLPPEQFAGEKGTVKSDFYSLGVILFEMLTGKLPYTADSFATLGKQKSVKKAPLVSEFTLECPMWLEKIVETLLEIDPENRPFSARSIIVALDDVKRADRQGTGVAEKMTSGFSPLTAGKDKSAAKKVLGIKRRKPATHEVPFFHRTSVLASTLTVVILLMFASLIFVLRPASSQQLLIDAERMANNGDNYAAQKKLTELLSRENDEFREEAEFMLVKLRIRKLMSWAENRPILADHTVKGETRDFFRAYEYEKDGRYDDALTAYDAILTNVSFEDLEDRHFYRAASERKEGIQKKMAEKKQASNELPDSGALKSKRTKHGTQASKQGSGDEAQKSGRSSGGNETQKASDDQKPSTDEKSGNISS